MRVTVLCALYKSGQYLESKIDSIFKLNNWQNAKFVFLNTQDLDNESTIIKPLCKKYKNITHIHFQSYRSLYQTWNYAIDRSVTDYIATYNADDQWHPDYLDKMVDYLDKNPTVSMVTSGILISDVPNQLYPNWNNIIGVIPKLAYPRSTAGPCPMWRRSLHSKYGLFGNYKVIGDARFWEALHAGGEAFGLVNDDLVLYYCNAESLERRIDEETGKSLREIDLEKAS